MRELSEPVTAMETIQSRYSTCIGPSMYPTLKPGDGIEFCPYKTPSEMRVGDVIVYPHPNGTMDVVHRIIAVRDGVVITRGDNNNKIDPYNVHFDHITGKVTGAKRRRRRISIKGGKSGFFIHKLMLFRKYARPYALAPFRFISNRIAASGLFNMFHSALDLKIVQIQRNHDSLRILVSGNRAIGKQMAGSGEWRIRFPYKLFINKDRLLKEKD